jgi:hypothetical protein
MVLVEGHHDAVEHLDKVFCCLICREAFLFKSDADDHERMMGHSEMRALPLS